MQTSKATQLGSGFALPGRSQSMNTWWPWNAVLPPTEPEPTTILKSGCLDLSEFAMISNRGKHSNSSWAMTSERFIFWHND